MRWKKSNTVIPLTAVTHHPRESSPTSRSTNDLYRRHCPRPSPALASHRPPAPDPVCRKPKVPPAAGMDPARHRPLAPVRRRPWMPHAAGRAPSPPLDSNSCRPAAQRSARTGPHCRLLELRLRASTPPSGAPSPAPCRVPSVLLAQQPRALFSGRSLP
jgi:hypothetical protein